MRQPCEYILWIVDYSGLEPRGSGGRDLEAISHWVLMGMGQIAQVLYINK